MCYIFGYMDRVMIKSSILMAYFVYNIHRQLSDMPSYFNVLDPHKMRF